MCVFMKSASNVGNVFVLSSYFFPVNSDQSLGLLLLREKLQGDQAEVTWMNVCARCALGAELEASRANGLRPEHLGCLSLQPKQGPAGANHQREVI